MLHEESVPPVQKRYPINAPNFVLGTWQARGHPNLGRGKRADFAFFKCPPGGHFAARHTNPLGDASASEMHHRAAILNWRRGRMCRFSGQPPAKELIYKDKKMPTRIQHSQTAHRRRMRIRRTRVVRFRHASDSPKIDRPVKVPDSAAARHQYRATIYDRSYAKLNVKPDTPLETKWGDFPTELVEVIAGHMDPRDVARLRGVSSGWRAALWQERVVRASLSGCGPRVDDVVLYSMIMNSRLGIKSFKAHLELPLRGPWPSTMKWEPVLDEMGPWDDYIRLETHDTLTRICCAVVPMKANDTQDEYQGWCTSFLEELHKLESQNFF
jgi:hypothetical protein